MAHETTLQPEPVCPACGHAHRDAWEWSDSGDHDCHSCGEPFFCERVVTVDYTTKAIDREENSRAE